MSTPNSPVPTGAQPGTVDVDDTIAEIIEMRRRFARKEIQAFSVGEMLYPARATGGLSRPCDIVGCQRSSVDLIAEPNGSILFVCREDGVALVYPDKQRAAS